MRAWEVPDEKKILEEAMDFLEKSSSIIEDFDGGGLTHPFDERFLSDETIVDMFTLPDESMLESLLSTK